MASIALVGGDGAGKSTIGRMLRESGVLPFKYLYMGINPESSNIMLPTSWLLFSLRRHGHSTTSDPDKPAPSSGPARRRTPRIRAVLRLTNRLAEECFRQVVSWTYQLRGYVVLYDRHYLFDFYRIPDAASPAPLSERVHLWFLANLYPKPDLVIFLDAPAEVLIARKQDDKPLEFLQSRREAILQLGRHSAGFIRVDVTRPLDTVYCDVMAHIERFRNGSEPIESGCAPATSGEAPTPNGGGRAEVEAETPQRSAC